MGSRTHLKKFTFRLSFFAGLFFLGASTLLALQVPPRPDGYVTDQAGLLSASAREGLETDLRAFEEKTSNQVVVATFPSLEGDSLEDFSMRLAQAWKAGQQKKDNGVIFLIFKNDRKMRIEVGYGLEGVLTDALSGEIIRRVVAPYFQSGRYEDGVLAGAHAIMKATQGEFKGVAKKKPSDDLWALALFFFFFFMLNIFSRRSTGFTGRRGGGSYIYTPLGMIHRGGGGLRTGGFGGFSGGGGSFGGGGASGGW